MLNEYFNMHLIYRAIVVNGRRTVQIYAERCKIAYFIGTLDVDRFPPLS